MRTSDHPMSHNLSQDPRYIASILLLIHTTLQQSCCQSHLTAEIEVLRHLCVFIEPLVMVGAIFNKIRFLVGIYQSILSPFGKCPVLDT